MSNFSSSHRARDAAQAVGYGTVTLIGGAVTLPLAVVGAVMFPTGVLTIPAAAFVLGAVLPANLTVYAGAKTYHKALHAMDIEHKFKNPTNFFRKNKDEAPVIDDTPVTLDQSNSLEV